MATTERTRTIAAPGARDRPTRERLPVRAPWWERHLAWLLIAPTILMLIVFAIIPSIYVIRYAFSRVKLVRGGVTTQWLGLDNFRRAFADPLIKDAVVITLKWMVGVTAAEVVLGLALALLMTQNIRWRPVWTTLLIIPIVVPPISIGIGWLFMYNLDFGVINYLLNQIGIASVPWLSDARIALYAMMFVDVWQATPFAFLLLYAGLVALPRDPYEAAAIDGATPWQIFRTITWPLIKPILLVVVLLRLIDSARIFDKIQIMTMGGPGTSAYSFTLVIYQVFTTELRTGVGYAAALSFLFQLALIIVASFYVKRVMADYTVPTE